MNRQSVARSLARFLMLLVACGGDNAAGETIPSPPPHLPVLEHPVMAVPGGLSRVGWASIRAALEAETHAAYETADGSLAMRNPRQRWEARFDGLGFVTQPDSAAWTWGLRLMGYGFSGAERSLSGPAPTCHRRNRIDYRWDDLLAEWFINDSRGLEHGWTLTTRPGGAAQGERLKLLLEVRGGLRPDVSADGSSVSFCDRDGETVLIYGGLKAWDDAGRRLAIQFETDGAACIRVCV